MSSSRSPQPPLPGEEQQADSGIAPQSPAAGQDAAVIELPPHYIKANRQQVPLPGLSSWSSSCLDQLHRAWILGLIGCTLTCAGGSVLPVSPPNVLTLTHMCDNQQVVARWRTSSVLAPGSPMSIDDDPPPVDGGSTCASATVCRVADGGQRSAPQSTVSCPLEPSRGTARHDRRDRSPQKAAVESPADGMRMQTARPIPWRRHRQQQRRQYWPTQVPPSEPRFNSLPPVPASVSAPGAHIALQQPWPGLIASCNGVFLPGGWAGARTLNL